MASLSGAGQPFEYPDYRQNSNTICRNLLENRIEEPMSIEDKAELAKSIVYGSLPSTYGIICCSDSQLSSLVAAAEKGMLGQAVDYMKCMRY